nr:hypothetical protein [Tanacetum cinerariifolium]
MFDEYFKPPPNVDHPVPEVPTPVPAASTSLHSSTTFDQDAPLISISQTTSEQQSSVIPQGVEDDFYNSEVSHMDNDPYFGYMKNYHHYSSFEIADLNQTVSHQMESDCHIRQISTKWNVLVVDFFSKPVEKDRQ